KRRKAAERVDVVGGEPLDAGKLPNVDLDGRNSRRSFYLHGENTVHDVLRLLRLPSRQESRLHTEAAGTAPPDAFGPFRVLHQIGAGTLGPVFRGYDAERERLVAIKLFTIELAPDRVRRLVGRFERLIASNLTHPSIAAPLAA